MFCLPIPVNNKIMKNKINLNSFSLCYYFETVVKLHICPKFFTSIHKNEKQNIQCF